MTISPGSIDHSTDVDLTSLSAYLQQQLSLRGALTATLIAGGRSNPTYELADGHSRWIMRRPPYGDVLKSTHDVLREARIVSALAGSSVPVPNIVAACEDASLIGAPFYVMDKLEGRTFRTHADTSELTSQQRAMMSDALLDTLVDLHEIDPLSIGLESFGRSKGYLERQLARWGRQWKAVCTSERAEVDELLRRLSSSIPRTRFPGIVHGDYKIDNVMVDVLDPAKIVGVLDWEMATLGDTLADLGILVSFWDEIGQMHNPITAGATAHPGFPSSDQIIEKYAHRRGIDIDDIDWYVVFADFKIAVILEQIHARHLQGTTVGAGFDGIGDMVGPLLQRALDKSSTASDPSLKGA